MNLQDPVVVNLRNEVQKLRQDLTVYRNLYKRECDEMKQLKIDCHELQHQIANLLEQNETLSEQLDGCHEHIDSFQIPKPTKKWCELTSPNSIAKRKCEYKRCLSQSLMYLHEVKRACVQLHIGNKEIFFFLVCN